MAESRPYERLEHRLGHEFRDPAVLESALTHKSYLNERPSSGRSDNERLEFLGDAVVDLVVGHLLMERFPGLREGDLSMLRAQIVAEPGLAEAAAALGLGEWLYLGRGEEQSGGRHKPSLLADAFEAVVAAVYLDGGFVAAFEVVRRELGPRLATTSTPGQLDHKTRLQELTQAERGLVPRYAVTSERGPDHDKVFEVAVLLDGQELARADGKSKKEAEQRAAAKALAARDRLPEA